MTAQSGLGLAVAYGQLRLSSLRQLPLQASFSLVRLDVKNFNFLPTNGCSVKPLKECVCLHLPLWRGAGNPGSARESSVELNH